MHPTSIHLCLCCLNAAVGDSVVLADELAAVLDPMLKVCLKHARGRFGAIRIWMRAIRGT